MTCTTHHTGCECHEAKWQKVASALYNEYVGTVSAAGYPNVEQTVADWMRIVGLVRRDGKWEFIDVP